jgi:hypothetical protein
MATSWASAAEEWSGRPASIRGRARAWSTSPARLRRNLQLCLGGLWVLDGVLQFQPFMFSSGFAARILAPAAGGNPRVVAAPITWVAGTVGHHPGWANAAFASIQLLLGLGIAFRPTLRPALAASIGWALGVWWFGEGFGGILTGAADPWSGAPGAAVLYAVLAVLLWPRDRSPDPGRRSVSVADLPWGRPVASAAWVALWCGLAILALLGVGRSTAGLRDVIDGMAGGEPAWLADVNSRAAGFAATHGEGLTLTLALISLTIAFAVFAPVALARGILVFAILVAAVIWIGVQDLGGIFGREGTDPNSGPLLALMAAAYWPFRTAHGSPEPGPEREVAA